MLEKYAEKQLLDTNILVFSSSKLNLVVAVQTRRKKRGIFVVLRSDFRFKLFCVSSFSVSI